MIALVCSVIFSTLLIILFKWFALRNIDTFQAIVTNYAVAAFCGLVYMGHPTQFLSTAVTSGWLPVAAVMGMFFILIFQFFGLTARAWGASVTSIAAKMSMIIPIAFGILYFHESAGSMKIIGILIALGAVYFSTARNNSQAAAPGNWLYPLVLFIGSGLIDTSLTYGQRELIKDGETIPFMTVIFFFAFVTGLAVLIYKILIRKQKLHLMSVFWGLALGIANWGSLLFLLLALNNHSLESSVIFTLNNIGIILCSIAAGIFIFKEKPERKQWLGIILSLIAIYFVSY